MLFVYVDKLKVKTSRNVKRSFYKNLVQNTTHTERKLKKERREEYTQGFQPINTKNWRKIHTYLLCWLIKIVWRGKMFKNTFQSGFLSILYSIGSKPLQIWDKKVRNGHIKRITDPDIQSFVLEIVGTNVSTTYITCPADPRKTLGIKLPYLVMIVKNMKKYFTFEVQVNVHLINYSD